MAITERFAGNNVKEIKYGDATIKQVQKFNYLESTLTEDGICDIKVRESIGKATDVFQKLSKGTEKLVTGYFSFNNSKTLRRFSESPL